MFFVNIIDCNKKIPSKNISQEKDGITIYYYDLVLDTTKIQLNKFIRDSLKVKKGQNDQTLLISQYSQTENLIFIIQKSFSGNRIFILDTNLTVLFKTRYFDCRCISKPKFIDINADSVNDFVIECSDESYEWFDVYLNTKGNINTVFTSSKYEYFVIGNRELYKFENVNDDSNLELFILDTNFISQDTMNYIIYDLNRNCIFK